MLLGFLPAFLFSCSQAALVDAPMVEGADITKAPLPQIRVCTKLRRQYKESNPDAKYHLLVQYTDGTSLGYQLLAEIEGSTYTRYAPVGGPAARDLSTTYQNSDFNVDTSKTIKEIRLAAEYRITGFSNDYITLPINRLAAQQLADGVQMYLPIQTAEHAVLFTKPTMSISSGWYC